MRLGRTELRVSGISFGSTSSSDAALVRHAFDRGVNYFDTAESYRWGGAEEVIGEALQGKREQVVLSSKTKAGASDGMGEGFDSQFTCAPSPPLPRAFGRKGGSPLRGLAPRARAEIHG